MKGKCSRREENKAGATVPYDVPGLPQPPGAQFGRRRAAATLETPRQPFAASQRGVQLAQSASAPLKDEPTCEPFIVGAEARPCRVWGLPAASTARGVGRGPATRPAEVGRGRPLCRASRPSGCSTSAGVRGCPRDARRPSDMIFGARASAPARAAAVGSVRPYEELLASRARHWLARRRDLAEKGTSSASSSSSVHTLPHKPIPRTSPLPVILLYLCVRNKPISCVRRSAAQFGGGARPPSVPRGARRESRGRGLLWRTTGGGADDASLRRVGCPEMATGGHDARRVRAAAARPARPPPSDILSSVAAALLRVWPRRGAVRPRRLFPLATVLPLHKF